MFRGKTAEIQAFYGRASRTAVLNDHCAVQTAGILGVFTVGPP